MAIKCHTLNGTTCRKGTGALRKIVCEKLICPGTHDEHGGKHSACLLQSGSIVRRIAVAAYLRKKREPPGNYGSTTRRVEKHVLVSARARKERHGGDGSVTRERGLKGALAHSELFGAERGLAELLWVSPGDKPIRGTGEIGYGSALKGVFQLLFP